MDVQHQPHHDNKKKTWKSYFWDFLMLFLAVFAGFLAENVREDYVEHQREKQYANTLYEELREDTAEITKVINAAVFVTAKIDTFRMLVQTKEIASLPAGTWYYYGRFGTRYFHIASQDATMEQLKNSGGLRYFKNQKVVNAIARYDQATRDMRTILNFQNLTFGNQVITRNKLFNAYYLDEVMDFDVSTAKIDSFKHATMPLLSTRKEDFIQYANDCQMRSYNNKYLLNTMRTALKRAEELIKSLESEYHL